MRNCISIGIVGLLLILATSAPSIAQEPLKVGPALKLNGALGKDKRTETFRVLLEEKTVYTIEMMSPDNRVLDPYLRLRDADGKLLAEDDDSGSAPLDAKIVFDCQRSGVYLIEAASFGNFGEGPYTIQILAKGAGVKIGLPPAFAQRKMSPNDRDSLSGLLNSATRKLDINPTDAFIANFQTETANFGVIDVEFKSAEACKAFTAPGATVFHRFDRFASIFMGNKEALAALERNADVTWIDVVDSGYLPPPVLVSLNKASSRVAPKKTETLIHGGIDVPQTGKGVIVAIIDTGLDFHHPDFITQVDGQPKSRLLYFWDTLADRRNEGEQSAVPPIRYPNGVPVGAVYTQAQLSAALAGKGVVTAWDTNGHGTACASVAAGNGRGAPDVLKKENIGIGVAPEADLIAVRIAGSGRDIKQIFVLGAVCDWIDKIARERNQPYVISCSFGSPFGSHDGNRVRERRLDAQFPADAPGKAICISAGNDGEVDQHAEITFAGAEASGLLAWKQPQLGFDTPLPRLVIYFDGADIDDVAFGKGDISLIRTYFHPTANCVVSEARLTPTLSRSGSLSVWSRFGKKIKADAYLERGPGFFTGPCVKRGMQVGDPASAKNAIAVGSYDWNSLFHRYGEFLDYNVIRTRNYAKGSPEPMILGELSAYSSQGPGRTGAVRPDIAAPGQWHCSAAAGNVDTIERDTSGRYRLFNGTSAACPYTAGVVALMMQKNPQITLTQIRQLFRTHAVRDEQTGTVPNAGWGHGRLNREAVVAMLKAIP